MTQPVMTADPNGEPMPVSYRWLAEFRTLNGTAWQYIDEATSAALRAEFQAETAAPNDTVIKDCLPFAQGGENDDVAAFVLENGRCTGAVISIHLTHSKKPESDGWPGIWRHRSLWEWLAKNVILAMEIYPDADIVELLDSPREEAGPV
jgi:hypothetical protein